MAVIRTLKSNKSRLPRFDKILVIKPIAKVYGVGNERQLCSAIVTRVDTFCKCI